MQKLFLIFALVGLASASRMASTSYAKAWMTVHRDDPDQDAQLAALKTADPNSYAIVKALLAKQKMGMLSTQRAATSSSADTDQQYSASSSSAADESSSAVANSAADSMSMGMGSSNHNWLAWKPNDDAAMVNNVLGQVAALRNAPAAQEDTSTSSWTPAGLISQQSQVNQQYSAETATQAVTNADTNMDLSFGAYQQAATEATQADFTANAKHVEQAEEKMQGGNAFGINMDWDQGGASAIAPASPAAPAAPAQTNSYLAQYPLSMAQEKKSPMGVLGAWLQRNGRGGRRSSELQTDTLGGGSNPYKHFLY